MNKNINLLEVLKDAPKGTKLWSPIFGECEFQGIYTNKSPIICTHTIKEYVLGNSVHEFADFLGNGKLATCCGEDGECLLFPSKNNRDWSTFKVPKKHKEFKPFQKVLVKELVGKCRKYVWTASEYSHYDEDTKLHYCSGAYGFADDEIIPYEDNEDKLGTLIETK